MVAPSPPFILGLDLHGTLLEPGERLREELVAPVSRALNRLQGRLLRFLCTGNDLEFVTRKIPAPILAEIDGHVLETGCSMSPDGKAEKTLTTPAELKLIRELEGLLRQASFPEVNYFAHRLTTISMFCDDPRGFHDRVERFVSATPFHGRVHITYSSVAVDILPRGYDKRKGLAAAGAGRQTIGVADSMNDRALLAEADFALAPSNLAPELRPLLAEAGREIIPLGRADRLIPRAVLVAAGSETEGVLEILAFLDRAIRA